MLDHETRSAVLRLAEEGHGTRFIARAVGVSRVSVKRVLASGQADVVFSLCPAGELPAFMVFPQDFRATIVP